MFGGIEPEVVKEDSNKEFTKVSKKVSLFNP
jgi:hypothetical protein